MPPFLPRNRIRTPSPETPTLTPQDKSTSKSNERTSRKPTLADALDSSARPKRTVGEARKLLVNLVDSDEDESSELSSLSDSELDFEDVPPAKRLKSAKHAEPADVDADDDDIEFEDVPTTEIVTPAAAPAPLFSYDNQDEGGDLDLTLTKETRISITNPHDKKQAPTKIERGIRVATHQMHVQFLLWHNTIRNAWACDKEVQQILLKQLGPGVEKEISTWRRASGLEVQQNAEARIAPTKGKTKAKAKGKGQQKEDDRRSKDWGANAQRQTSTEVDMSHGDPLFRLVKTLTLFWKSRFRVTEPGLKKLGYMPLDRMDEELKSFQKDLHDPDIHGERVKDLKEFRERARSCEGSRDLGAQLFTALLRGIGLEARMVASLQPVGFGWSANEEAVERKTKKTISSKPDRDIGSDASNEDVQMEDVSLPYGTKTVATSAPDRELGKAKKSARKRSRASGARDMPIDLSDDEMEVLESIADDDSIVDVTPAKQRRSPSKLYEKDLSPNYWTEILSPVTKTYLAVSTLIPDTGAATNADLLSFFEPKGKKAEKAKQVMAYIVGFSADGTAKDVTVRYLKKHMFPGKTKGMRMTVEKVPIYGKNGKVKRYEEYDWFKTVMSGYIRRGKNKGDVDDHEEATDLKVVKPERKVVKDGEESLASYKASKEFVLERHMKREEALLGAVEHVKTFTIKGKKGAEDEEEKVYLRKDIVSCKTQETWHKEGRRPKQGEEPRKRVPYRVATLNRKRELAELERETGQVPLQGLYSIDQTELIIPPPIENGVIPKNAYGNIDLFTPEMCPAGAIHIPYKGMKKVCNLMGIDFAEAVTGFEFGGRMAIPVITGVVVADKYEEECLERWHVVEAERVRKEDLKRQGLILGVWRKLLMGMRIRQRVAAEYGEDVDGEKDESNPWTNKQRDERIEAESRKLIAHEEDEYHGGGFFPEGYTEEEPVQAQGFFPTTHGTDDEDDAGGFVVEEGGVNDRPSSDEHQVTQVSTTSKHDGLNNARLKYEFQAIEGMADDSDTDTLPAKKPGSLSKSGAKDPPVARMSKARNRKSTATSRTKVTPSASFGGRRKVQSTKEENEVGPGESSSLSDPASHAESSNLGEDNVEEDDDNEEEEQETKIKTRRKPTSKQPAKRSTVASQTRAPRATPKRQAARRSATALRSHYFEASDEDEA